MGNLDQRLSDELVEKTEGEIETIGYYYKCGHVSLNVTPDWIRKTIPDAMSAYAEHVLQTIGKHNSERHIISGQSLHAVLVRVTKKTIKVTTTEEFIDHDEVV